MSLGELLVGGGIGAVLVAVVNAIVARRKLAADTDKAGAEATSVLTAAALTLVQPLEHRIKELTAEVDTLRVAVKQAAADLEAAHGREAAGQAREAAKDALLAEFTRPATP